MAGKTFRLPPLPSLKPKVEPTVDWQSGGVDAEVEFKFSGLSALVTNLMSMPYAAIDAAGFEMEAILDDVLLDSQATYVPIDTGALHDSGDHDTYIPGKVPAGGIAEMRVWYAGDAPVGQAIYGMEGRQIGNRHKGLVTAHGLNEVKNPKLYALDQHENVEYRHPVGGRKYLEIPFNKAQSTVLERIAGAVARVMGLSDLQSIENALRSAPNYPGFGPNRK